MNKKDVLEKSKGEYKNSDPYATEVRKTCMQRGMVIILLMSLLFFFTELLIKHNLHLGFLAINCVSNAVNCWAEYKLHPKKSTLIVLIITIVGVIAAAAGYMVSLFLR